MATPPAFPGRRLSMTAQQRESIAGAELLALCQSVTADGRLAAEELEALRTWLQAHPDDAFPAIAHIRWVIDQILADGRVTPDENKLLRAAIEKVLPPDIRAVAAVRRREADRDDAQAVRAAKAADAERARAEEERQRPLLRLDFMVAGTRYEGRGRLIEAEVDVETPITLIRDPENRFSRHAIRVCLADGRAIGFVPEDLAVACAPMMDAGAQADVFVKRLLDRATPPIPIIAGALYGADATLPPREPPVARHTRAPEALPEVLPDPPPAASVPAAWDARRLNALLIGAAALLVVAALVWLLVA